jgi:hypothetical protein
LFTLIDFNLFFTIPVVEEIKAGDAPILIILRFQKTDDPSSLSELRRGTQKTEDRRQRTEIRIRKKEN